MKMQIDRSNLLKVVGYSISAGIILAFTFGITVPVFQFGLNLLRTKLFFEVVLGFSAIVGISIISGIIDFQICKTAFRRISKLWGAKNSKKDIQR